MEDSIFMNSHPGLIPSRLEVLDPYYGYGPWPRHKGRTCVGSPAQEPVKMPIPRNRESKSILRSGTCVPIKDLPYLPIALPPTCLAYVKDSSSWRTGTVIINGIRPQLLQLPFLIGFTGTAHISTPTPPQLY